MQRRKPIFDPIQHDDEKQVAVERIFSAKRRDQVATPKHNTLGCGNEIHAAVGVFNGPQIHVLEDDYVRVYGTKMTLCWEGYDDALSQRVRKLDATLRKAPT